MMNLLLAGGAALGIGKLLADHDEFVTKRNPYEKLIVEAATANGINPSVVAAVLWQESRFNPKARGSAGEIGMAQFKPIALRDVQENVGVLIGSSVDDLFDPAKAIIACASLLALNKKRLGSIFLSIRAYNQGVGAVKADPTIAASYLLDVLKNAGVDMAYRAIDSVA